jgi:hypothetical protein
VPRVLPSGQRAGVRPAPGTGPQLKRPPVTTHPARPVGAAAPSRRGPQSSAGNATPCLAVEKVGNVEVVPAPHTDRTSELGGASSTIPASGCRRASGSSNEAGGSPARASPSGRDGAKQPPRRPAGAHLGHAPGDNHGQSRSPAVQSPTRLTWANAHRLTRLGRHALYGMQGVKAGIGLAVPGRPIRSLVAEDRSAAGVRDRTGPEPRTCSRRAHETVRHWEEQRGTVTRGGEAKTQLGSPVRYHTDTSERRSNDS